MVSFLTEVRVGSALRTKTVRKMSMWWVIYRSHIEIFKILCLTTWMSFFFFMPKLTNVAIWSSWIIKLKNKNKNPEECNYLMGKVWLVLYITFACYHLHDHAYAMNRNSLLVGLNLYTLTKIPWPRPRPINFPLFQINLAIDYVFVCC